MAEKKELLTQTEFSRRVGVTVQRVNQLVKKGRIPVTSNKRIVWPDARDLWEANHLDADQPAAEPAGQDEDDSGIRTAHRATREETSSNAKLTAAKARKEAARARLAELDLAEREERLIPVEEVRADAVAVLSSLRAALLALPGQVALRCEGKPATEIEGLLADHVNTLISEWHQGRWSA